VEGGERMTEEELKEYKEKQNKDYDVFCGKVLKISEDGKLAILATTNFIAKQKLDYLNEQIEQTNNLLGEVCNKLDKIWGDMPDDS
jgi:hypothetical protein